MQQHQQHPGSIPLVQTVFENRLDTGDWKYKLQRVIERTHAVGYQGFPVVQLRHACVTLFNRIYTARCNDAAIRIAFVTATTAYLCAPSTGGRCLDVVSRTDTEQWDRTCEEGATVVYRAGASTVESAAFTMFCLTFDYIHMPSARYILVGISALPCVPMGMPEEWTPDVLHNWLQYWCDDRIHECAEEGRLVLRDDERQCRVLYVREDPRERRGEKVIVNRK